VIFGVLLYFIGRFASFFYWRYRLGSTEAPSGTTSSTSTERRSPVVSSTGDGGKPIET